MRIGVTVIALGLAFVPAFTPGVVYGQTPTPVAANGATAAPAGTTPGQKPAAPQPPATGLVQQEELTGSWGGVRTRWKDKGVVLDSSLTQFYPRSAVTT